MYIIENLNLTSGSVWTLSPELTKYGLKWSNWTRSQVNDVDVLDVSTKQNW